jgi:hypothetical protein
MRGRKRFTLKVFAVAFAAAVLSAPAAQAMPELPGDQARALQEAKAKNARAASAKTIRRVSAPRRPIREYEPQG